MFALFDVIRDVSTGGELTLSSTLPRARLKSIQYVQLVSGWRDMRSIGQLLKQAISIALIG